MPLIDVSSILYWLLPIPCVAAAPALGRGIAGKLVTGVAIYQLLLLVPGMVLGFLGILHPAAYLTATALAVAVAGLAARSSLRQTRGDFCPLFEAVGSSIAHPALALSLALISWMLAVQLIVDGTLGTAQGDALSYHIPRALHWTWHGDFWPWPTPEWREIGLPIAADVVLGSKLLLGLGWTGMAYVTVWLTIGAAAAIYVAAGALGMRHDAALSASLLFLSSPAIGQRIVAGNSDIVAAFPALAAAVILLFGRGLVWADGAALLLSAVAVACKPTVLPALLVVGALAVIGRRRLNPRPAGVSVAAMCLGGIGGGAVIAGSYAPVYAAFGDLFGGEFGRAHSNIDAGLGGMVRAALFATVRWGVEPLGYVIPSALRERLFAGAGLPELYRALGAVNVADYIPNHGPETTGTGLSALVLFILVCARAPRRDQVLALVVLTGFLVSSAIVAVQPWSARFPVVIYGLFALAGVAAAFDWGAAGARWCIRLVTLSALVAATSSTRGAFHQMEDYEAARGVYAYMPSSTRARIEATRDSRPPLLLSESEYSILAGGTPAAMITGPGGRLRFEHVMCPRSVSWTTCLADATKRSGWLAVYYDTPDRLLVGPSWDGSGKWWSTTLERANLVRDLEAAGWRLDTSSAEMELWTSP